MTLTFPHGAGCPICSTCCDDVDDLRRQVRTLRFLVLGSLWIAASSTRPRRDDIEQINQIRELANEAVQMAGVLDLDADVLAAIFPEEDS